MVEAFSWQLFLTGLPSFAFYTFQYPAPRGLTGAFHRTDWISRGLTGTLHWTDWIPRGLTGALALTDWMQREVPVSFSNYLQSITTP